MSSTAEPRPVRCTASGTHGADATCQQPGCTEKTLDSTAALCSQHGYHRCRFKGCTLPTQQLRVHYCPVHHGQKELLPRPQQAAAPTGSSGANGVNGAKPGIAEELASVGPVSKLGSACWLPRRRPDWWWLGLQAPEYGSTEFSVPPGTARLIPPPPSAAGAVGLLPPPGLPVGSPPASFWNPFSLLPPPYPGLWPRALPPAPPPQPQPSLHHVQPSIAVATATTAGGALASLLQRPGLIAPLAVPQPRPSQPAAATAAAVTVGRSQSLDFFPHGRITLEGAPVAGPLPPHSHSLDGVPSSSHLPPPHHHHGHQRRLSLDGGSLGAAASFHTHQQSVSPPTVESVSESEQASNGLSDTASGSDVPAPPRGGSGGGFAPHTIGGVGVGRAFSSPACPVRSEVAGSWDEDTKYRPASSQCTFRTSVDESSPPECSTQRGSGELVKPVAHKPVPGAALHLPDGSSSELEVGGSAASLCQFAGCSNRVWVGPTPRSSLEAGPTPRTSLEARPPSPSAAAAAAASGDPWQSLPRNLSQLPGGGGRTGQNAFRPLAPKRGESAAAAASFCGDHLGAKPCQHEDCTKVAWGATLFCAEHREAKRCQMEGCTVHLKYSKRRRFCKAHTPSHCLHEGCTKRRQDDSGFCFAHGGGKRCAFAGCARGACKMGNTLFCIAHGGGLRCQHDGCKFSDRGHTGLCRMHGGGKRCQYNECNKSAVGGTLHCVAHGGGLRCQHKDCDRCVAARGNRKFCVPHGGGIRCHHEGCAKVTARGSKQFCVEHGGGHRCRQAACKRLAAYPTEFCKGHGGGSRCQHEGCTKSAQSLAPMLCAAHGGGKRCEFEGCTKSAARVGNKLHCAKHGGGHRCQYDGCEKSAWTSARLCRTHAITEKRGSGGPSSNSSPSSSCSFVRSASEVSSVA